MDNTNQKQKIAEILIANASKFNLINKSLVESFQKIRKLTELPMLTFMDQIAPMIESLKQHDWNAIKEIYEEFGWLEAIAMPYMFEMESEFKAGGKEQVWQKLISDFSDNNFIKELKQDISNIKLLKKRKKILWAAIDRHQQKDYICSVPLLLSQNEGILWDLGVNNGLVESKPNSQKKIDSKGEILINDKGEEEEWRLGDLLITLFGKDSKLRTHTQHKVYSIELRNPTLHGRKTDYATSQTSTMLLLLLLMFIEKIEDETRNPNTEK